MTVLTPSFHAEAYSPEDNRFDMRPFLYPSFYLSFVCSKVKCYVEDAQRKCGIWGDGKKVVKGDWWAWTDYKNKRCSSVIQPYEITLLGLQADNDAKLDAS